MKPKPFVTPAHFRAWLEEHHETEKALLVGFHKKVGMRAFAAVSAHISKGLSSL